MHEYAQKHEISVALPYLAAFELLSSEALDQRVNENLGKVILRQLA